MVCLNMRFVPTIALTGLEPNDASFLAKYRNSTFIFIHKSYSLLIQNKIKTFDSKILNDVHQGLMRFFF